MTDFAAVCLSVECLGAVQFAVRVAVGERGLEPFTDDFAEGRSMQQILVVWNSSCVRWIGHLSIECRLLFGAPRHGSGSALRPRQRLNG